MPITLLRSALLRRGLVLLVALVAAVTLAPSPAQAVPANCSASRFSYASDSQGSHAKYFSGYSYGVPFCLRSPDYNHYAIFQDDGNFVVYSSIGSPLHATWQSGTVHRGAYLYFQNDGNVVIYVGGFDGSSNPFGAASWNSGTLGTHRADYISMQNDGNLVLYNGAGVAQWSSRTAGR